VKVLLCATLAGLGLFAAVVGPLNATRAQTGQAVVRVVTPSDSVTKSNNRVEVSINVENVTNLAGFQFVLTVDPAVFKTLAASKTRFIGLTDRAIACGDPTIEAAAVRLACVTLGEKPAGVDGSGTIATVTLQPLAEGASDIVLARVKLVHPDGTELPSTVANARLKVTGSPWWTTTRILLASGGAVLVALTALATVRRARGRVTTTSGAAAGPEAGA
jgi:hypothetical protein